LKQKQAAMLAVCAILLFCIAAAGCTSSTSSSPNATNASSTTTSAQASASISTPSASAAPTSSSSPTATASPTQNGSGGGSAGFTVLFFYKPGCPYCAALESTSSFAQLQTKVPVQWTVSATSPLTDQYGVTSDPTLILLKNGTEIGRWVDATDATGALAQINAG
jgi:thiol-disulfide isomerase/thioredoxin